MTVPGRRIALASCDPFPPVPDDEEPLRAALRSRGVTVEEPAWDARTDWRRFAACLVRTTWDYMERREEYLEWARRVAAQTRIFHPPQVIAWNTHKSYLRALEAAGVPLAQSVWLDRGASVDLATLLRDRDWESALVKPMVGATARRTLRLGRADVVSGQAQLDAWLAEEDMIVQQYLPAVETEGELSVIMVDGQITHGVRKIPVPGDYRVQDDFGARDEPWPTDARCRLLARDIATAAQGILRTDLLYARVDFLRDLTGDLVLNELELVEPQLFFRHEPFAGDRLAEALLARLD